MTKYFGETLFKKGGAWPVLKAKKEETSSIRMAFPSVAMVNDSSEEVGVWLIVRCGGTPQEVVRVFNSIAANGAQVGMVVVEVVFLLM